MLLCVSARACSVPHPPARTVHPQAAKQKLLGEVGLTEVGGQAKAEGGGRKSVLAKLRFLKKSGSLTGTIASARNQHAELQLKSFQRWWQSHLPAGTISDLELDIRTGVPLLMAWSLSWQRIVPMSVFQTMMVPSSLPLATVLGAQCAMART